MAINSNCKTNKIASDSITLTFVRVITMAVSILQTMMLSRSLPKLQYGTYQESLLVISFFSPFFSLGLYDSVNYFFNKSNNEEKRQSIINTIFTLCLLAGLIGAIMLLCFQNLVAAYFNNESILPLMVYIVFRPCLQNMIALFQPLYISNGYSRTIAFRNLIISLSQVIIIGIVPIFIQSVKLIFILLLLLDIVQVLVFFTFYQKKCEPLLLRLGSVDNIKTILKFSLPMLLSTSIGTISLNIDKLMVSHLLTTEEYALYANMSKELPFSFVISSFTAVVAPKIVSMVNSSNRKFVGLWKDYLELGYSITWPLCLGAFILAPGMIELLYSSTYLTSDGIKVFQAYTVVTMFRFTYFGMIPSALGKSTMILKYSFMSMVMNVVLNLLFYRIFGIIGLAIATIMSLLIMVIFYFRSSLRLVQLRLKEIVNWKHLGLTLLVMGVSTVVTVFADNYLLHFISSAVIKTIVEYILFIGIIAAGRFKRIVVLLKRMNAG